MIGMTVVWYDNIDIGKPDYSKPHYREFIGETPESIMCDYANFSWNHDVVKYSPTEIVGIFTPVK